MLHEELLSIRESLAPIMGRVSADDAAILRACRRNLETAAEDALALETRFLPAEELVRQMNGQGVRA